MGIQKINIIYILKILLAFIFHVLSKSWLWIVINVKTDIRFSIGNRIYFSKILDSLGIIYFIE